MEIVTNQLVKTFRSKISEIQEELSANLFAIENKELLKKIYLIFKRDESMKREFSLLLEEAIEEQGRRILESSSEDNKTMMQQLFDFKRNIDTLIFYACENESEVLQLKNLALSTCINASETATSAIATYADYCFTEDFKNKSDNSIKDNINDLVTIITLLRDRDIFLKQYSKDLTMRLVNETTVSPQDETRMIERMREEFGANAIFKLTSIMQDINASR